MRHPGFLWTVITLLAAASWWLGRGGKTPPGTSPLAKEVREIDYYARGLRATTMDLNGRPDRTLRAIELRHFMDDNTTELSQPRLTVHQEKQPPWEITSDKGWISSDHALVLLQGEVHIRRTAGDSVRPIRMDTRELRIQPQQDYAETDEKVRVRSEQDRIDATGMQAWFRPPVRIKFLANVKGYYAPP